MSDGGKKGAQVKKPYNIIILSVLLFSLFFYSYAYAARVDTIKVRSDKMHKEIPVMVFLPEGRAGKIQKNPVVYLLHGYGGDYSSWSEKVDLGKLADRYQFIIVCPDASQNSWYIDSPIDKDSQYETFITSELVRWVENHYPAIAKREGRAIAGLSMGGHGGLYLAAKHPNTYIAVGSMSGGVDLTHFTAKWDISEKLGEYDKFPERWRNHSVVNLADRFKNRGIYLAIDCGVSDFFIDDNRKLHEKLLRLNVLHDYWERPGGHSWEYWQKVLEYHLLFFKNAFSLGAY